MSKKMLAHLTRQAERKAETERRKAIADFERKRLRAQELARREREAAEEKKERAEQRAAAAAEKTLRRTQRSLIRQTAKYPDDIPVITGAERKELEDYLKANPLLVKTKDGRRHRMKDLSRIKAAATIARKKQ